MESEASSETMIALDHVSNQGSSYTLAWEHVSYSVKDKRTNEEKQLINDMVIYILHST